MDVRKVALMAGLLVIEMVDHSDYKMAVRKVETTAQKTVECWVVLSGFLTAALLVPSTVALKAVERAGLMAT